MNAVDFAVIALMLILALRLQGLYVLLFYVLFNGEVNKYFFCFIFVLLMLLANYD